MKKILCHLRVQDPDLLTEIHASAKKYGWLLETTDNCEMNGWFGDGVLSDYFSLEELNFIRNIHKIPVISREIHPEPNIYSVIGNTNTIAELAFRHFAGKGVKIRIDLCGGNSGISHCGIWYHVDHHAFI